MQIHAHTHICVCVCVYTHTHTRGFIFASLVLRFGKALSGPIQFILFMYIYIYIYRVGGGVRQLQGMQYVLRPNTEGPEQVKKFPTFYET